MVRCLVMLYIDWLQVTMILFRKEEIKLSKKTKMKRQNNFTYSTPNFQKSKKYKKKFENLLRIFDGDSPPLIFFYFLFLLSKKVVNYAVKSSKKVVRHSYCKSKEKYHLLLFYYFLLLFYYFFTTFLLLLLKYKQFI